MTEAMVILLNHGLSTREFCGIAVINQIRHEVLYVTFH